MTCQHRAPALGRAGVVGPWLAAVICVAVPAAHAQRPNTCTGQEQRFARGAEVSLKLCLKRCDEIRGPDVQPEVIEVFCAEANAPFCARWECDQEGFDCQPVDGRRSLVGNAHVTVKRCKDTRVPCRRVGNPTIHEVTLEVHGNGTIVCPCDCVPVQQ